MAIGHSSPENGVWACRQHARMIDRDDSHYLVTDRVSFRTTREERAGRDQAHRSLLGGVAVIDTARLVELPHVTKALGSLNRRSLIDGIRSVSQAFLVVQAFVAAPA